MANRVVLVISDMQIKLNDIEIELTPKEVDNLRVSLLNSSNNHIPIETDSKAKCQVSYRLNWDAINTEKG